MVSMDIKESWNKILPRDIRGEEQDGEIVQEGEGEDKRFYNNVNAKIVESVEGIATAIAIIHNILTQSKNRGCVMLTRQYQTASTI